MKKFKFITLAIAILGFTSISFAQTVPASTANALAGAHIIKSLEIDKATDLYFGNIIASGTEGTVELTAMGGTPTRTADGGVKLPVATGTPTAARFDVEGEANTLFTITAITDVTITSTDDNMIISSLAPAATTGTLGTLDASGKQTFYVGGTLTVKADQKAGTYSGNFDVTVNYN